MATSPSIYAIFRGLNMCADPNCPFVQVKAVIRFVQAVSSAESRVI